MNFIADLHIHSRFSRATSKQLSPRHLAAWARCKGINVLGTGDFTHPQWRDELRQQLVRDEASGLYRLSGPAEELDFLQGKTPPDADGPLFLLQTEISSIYKRQGKVRKVHNLIFVPTLDDADRLSQRLELVGNLHSDGRPILGLDSRDLLEMTLDVCPEAVLIPAHVWTPWFALFGSKSGFDRLEDCFDDLSSHIFALETGLSSDPGMNRMVSQLDGYALISNSDAHSGANLGREANFFAGAPSYDGIFAALRAAARRLPPEQQPQDCRFLGTMEFYPEEGKYHLDGHRACGVVLEPREALALDNICPVCGKPLTIGVLHRVCELADRETPASLLHEPEARPLIPLPELVGEILGVGSGSRKVQDRYAALLRELGPDLDILCRMDEEQVRRHWEPLGEAVARMRRGQVIRKGGYDGEYGVVRVFSPEEAAEWQGSTRSRSLLDGAAPRKRGRPKKVADPAPVPAPSRRASALPWRHVLVDEVQDLSPVQLRLIRALLPEDGNGFFGIGDPDQAIYGFRGASGQSEDSLRALWPSLRVCRLGQSYRASQGVLDMAQSLLQGRGHCGALQAMRREQARLHLFSAPDQQAEARWIAGRIRQLLGATAHTLMDQIAQEDELAGTLSPGDVAVLVRLKAQIPVIRRALEQEGIPCAAPAQEDCWQDPLCAAVLRLAIARGQGEAPVPVSDDAESDDLLPLLEQALDLAQDAPLPDPQALQARLSGHSRLPAPLWQGTAWKQLCRAWQDCGQWEALVQQLGLQHEAELIRARSEQVQILTLHASKGLEFQAVFLPGLEEGLLPMRRDLLLETPDDDMSPAAQAARLEEERRLFYVGLTRAARALYVSHSAGRRLFGRELALEPSSFLPLVRDFCRQSTLARHTKAVREHLSLF